MKTREAGWLRLAAALSVLGCFVVVLSPGVQGADQQVGGMPAPPAPPPPTPPSGSAPGGSTRPGDTVAEPVHPGRERPKPAVVTDAPQATPHPGRRKATTPGAVSPGQWAPPSGPGTWDPALELNALRGWELWWELHRDRFSAHPPRELSRPAGLIPPDPRTSVQSIPSRFGAFERVEPSLRLLLDHERSPVVLASALVAMAKLGEDPRLPDSRKTYAAILPFLSHADARVSGAAITALGILGTDAALFPLAQIAELGGEAKSNAADARDPTDRERALALYSMGLIGRETPREDVRRFAASRICRLFEREAQASAEIKFAALHALSLIPIADESAPARASQPAKSSRGWNSAERRKPSASKDASLKAIPSASRRAQLDWVLAVLDDGQEETWVKAQAATAVARLCVDLPQESPLRTRAIERLLAALAPRTDDAIEVGQSAVLALGELGDADSDALDARVRSALQATATEGSDQSMREFALLSLALSGSRPGGPVADADRLAGSDDVRRVLLHRAASARANVLPWSVLALGLFENGIARATGSNALETRAALRDLLLETRSAEVAGACCLALGLSGATEANRDLIPKLRDGDPRLRGHAATALGMLGAREAGTAIERLLEQARTTPELFQPASEALAALGAPVGRQLLGLMSGGISLESQMYLCFALGRVGDWRSLSALAELACDGSSLIWVRAAATSALGNLGTRRPEPWNADLGHALNFHALPETLRAASLDGLLDLE